MSLHIGIGMPIGLVKSEAAASPPVISDIVISLITDVSFRVACTIDPKGTLTPVLHYGETTSYGSTLNGSEISEAGEVVFNLTGLTPYTDYRIKVVAGATAVEYDSVVKTSPAFYVRPSGSTYGTGDGSSYENAWSGFAEIVTASLVPGSIIYVCGAHSEYFDVGFSGTTEGRVNIRFDYTDHPGSINATGLSIGMRVNNRSYLNIYKPTVYGATTSCIEYSGNSTNITAYEEIAYGSGNQGIQHLNTANIHHVDVLSYNNTDDGISSHDACTIQMTRGVVRNNAENINIIGTSVLSGTGVQVYAGSTCSIYPNAAGAIINLTDSFVEGNIQVGNGGVINITRCLCDSVLTSAAGGGVINADGCMLTKNSRTLANANCTINIVRSAFLDGSLPTNRHIIDQATTNGGTVNLNYVVFDNIPATRSAIVQRGSTAKVNCRNVTIQGNAAANGITVVDGVFDCYNTIITGCATGIMRTAGTVTTYNCCFYNNTANTSGTVTQNNTVTGNPNFTSVATNDYSLGVSSSCIGTGADLTSTYNTGLATSTTWGNGSDTLPSVVTKVQAAAWDIGAIIH